VHRELTAEGYRILPDRETALDAQLRDAALAVFLLGASFDEQLERLTDIAEKRHDKRWMVWHSPAAAASRDPDQLVYCDHLLTVESAGKTFLDANTNPTALKDEMRALLKPERVSLPEASGKPRVYLVYNARDQVDARSAGQIKRHYRQEFHFDYPDDPALHSRRLAASHGILLVWGRANEEWCAQEFKDILQVPRQSVSRGLCLFDPEEDKRATIDAIRARFADISITEQFGTFDPSRLEPFFSPIRRATTASS
jgi:hypothetical protein